MAEGDRPFINGNVFFASDANSFNERILEIYTGTDLDGGIVGTLTHELTATTFSAAKPTYLKIRVNGTFNASVSNENQSASVGFKIEVKDISGSYLTVFDRTIASASMANGTTFGRNSERVHFVEFLHTLTANEKTNGFQIKISTTIAETDGSAGFTNDQIIVEQIS